MRGNTTYHCERDCYLTDRDDITHCPRCGGKMLKDGDTSPENLTRLNQNSEQRQLAYSQEYANGRLYGGI